MEATQLDAGEFRAGQRRDWDKAAQGWQTWQEFIYGATAPVSERLVELAGIKPGDKVLDVAAGAGEPSLTAARVVGPEGSVVATDISTNMLTAGRERESTTSSSSRSRRPRSISRRRASMRRFLVGESSSSPTERPPQRAFAAS